MLRSHPDIRRWNIGNALWETAIAVLRVFVVLYFVKSLGLTLLQVSAVLALVGLAAVAAPLNGRLADRHGNRPVMLVALWVFAVGLLPPVFTTNKYFIAAIVPVAFAAVVFITLPYSMLMGLLDQQRQHGIGAGLFGFSRGSVSCSARCSPGWPCGRANSPSFWFSTRPTAIPPCSR